MKTTIVELLKKCTKGLINRSVASAHSVALSTLKRLLLNC